MLIFGLGHLAWHRSRRAREKGACSWAPGLYEICVSTSFLFCLVFWGAVGGLLLHGRWIFRLKNNIMR